MDIKPVKKYKTPNYPDKQSIIDNPELLSQLPNRWKKSIYVNAALSSLILFTLSSCRGKETGGTSIIEKEVMVAPVFDHGGGRGSFGCMSIAPPSFLSEEEAYQVIQEEGKMYGISFESNNLKLEGIEIPETKYYLRTEEGDSGSIKDKGEVIDSTRKGDLTLDGYDEEKKIGFEFISREDYECWHVDVGIRSSVDDFDFLTTARVLREGLLNKNDDTSIGVFYNPMESIPREELNKNPDDMDWEALEKRVKQSAEDNLREQVKDFLEWLKAQGIM